jgi:hypothetical protein
VHAAGQAKRGLTGIMNYTNPGAISHNEILELYKCYVDADFKWANFSVEEQAKVIVAPRSNNLLDTARVRAHTFQPSKNPFSAKFAQSSAARRCMRSCACLLGMG